MNQIYNYIAENPGCTNKMISEACNVSIHKVRRGSVFADLEDEGLLIAEVPADMEAQKGQNHKAKIGYAVFEPRELTEDYRTVYGMPAARLG